MTVFQHTAILAGQAQLLFNGNVSKVTRLDESNNAPLRSLNVGYALVSGDLSPLCFQKLVLFVSSGPSDVTIRALNGTSVTLSALTTNTLLNLDIQFSRVTWTGTATATGYLTE